MVDSANAYGGNCKESHPFTTGNCAEGKTRKDKPYPPRFGERFVFVLVAEARPAEDCERSEEDERGIEEDMTRLGDHAIFECNKERR